MASSTKVLTVNELAEYLRVHRSTIYRLLKKGQLPGFKIGSDWRFNVEVIDEWRFRPGPGALEEEEVGPAYRDWRIFFSTPVNRGDQFGYPSLSIHHPNRISVFTFLLFPF